MVYFSILYMRYQSGIVTDEMLEIPKSHFVLSGALEALGVAAGMAAAGILSLKSDLSLGLSRVTSINAIVGHQKIVLKYMFIFLVYGSEFARDINPYIATGDISIESCFLFP